jgi:DNA end-binding protein Ku
LNTLNRATGHRIRRAFVDGVTGEAVEKDDQVKGYETEKDHYVSFEPDEIAEASAKSDKTMVIKAFVANSDVDEACFDKPYYLAPVSGRDMELFGVLRDGLARRQVGAVAEAVLFRRLRSVLIRPHDSGMIATTLHFDYELRQAAEVFAEIPDLKIQDEMLDLAKHIINSKQGPFDPAQYTDRYETALADLVKAKLEGRAISAPARRAPSPSIDLLQALRDSAGMPTSEPPRKSARKTPAKPESQPRKPQPAHPRRRKAG